MNHYFTSSYGQELVIKATRNHHSWVGSSVFAAQVLFESFDGTMLHSMGEWLRLGADPAGFLEPEEVEEFLKLHRQVREVSIKSQQLDGHWKIQ